MTSSPAHRPRSFRQDSIVVLGVPISGATRTEDRELAPGSDGVVRVSRRLGEPSSNLEHVVVATCDHVEALAREAGGRTVLRMNLDGLSPHTSAMADPPPTHLVGASSADTAQRNAPS